MEVCVSRNVPPPPPSQSVGAAEAPHHSRAIAADGRRAPTPSHALRGVLPSAKTRPRPVRGRTFRAPAPAVAVTFRMSKMASLAAGVREALREGDDVLRPKTPVRTDAGRIVPPPRELAWCGGYQLGCDKNALKFSTDETLRHTQKWLVRHNSTGVLTRQAVDSMVPAAILGVEPHHRVLDLCASRVKTTQAPSCFSRRRDESYDSIRFRLAERVRGGERYQPAAVLLLVRWCAALGAATEALMVTTTTRGGSQPAAPISVPSRRWVPTVKRGTAERSTGSSATCRVPGTALRESADLERGARVRDRATRQLRRRAERRLQVCGHMVYSTCSFNPVENEAVVAALVEKCGGAVEIVDASDRVRGLRRRAGMTTWKVLTAEDEGAMTEWKTFEDTRREDATISPGLRRAFARSVFPKASGVTSGQAHQGPAPGAVHAARAARPGHGRLLRDAAQEGGPDPGAAAAARLGGGGVEKERGDARVAPTADDDADAQDARVRARANRRASRFERGVGHRHDRHVSFRPRRERDTGVVDVLRAGRQGAVYGGGGRVTGEVRLGRRARLRKARRGCGRVETQEACQARRRGFEFFRSR